MSGLIQRLFSPHWRRPRWQHQDPAVRARAAAQLDAQDAALETLARDAEPQVRQAALARQDSLDTLLAWHRAEPSEETYARLGELLSGRSATSPDLGERLQRLESIDDPRLLEAVIVDGDNQSLRLAALSRIQAEADLIHHAIHNGIAAVRRAAAERIESPEGLNQLAKEATRDKQVARLARERLAAQRANAEQQAAVEAERDQVLATLEAQSHRPWEPMYEARLKHWSKRWETLGDGADAAQQARYENAEARCRQRIADHHHEHREIERVKREKADAMATRERILETLSHALDIALQSPGPSAEGMHELEAKWQLQRERWQTLSDSYGLSDAYGRRHAELEQRAHRLWQAWERWQDEQEALKASMTHGEDPRAVLARLAWPADLPAPALVEQARQETARHRTLAADADDEAAAKNDTSLATLDALLAQLAQELDAGLYRPASHTHRQLRQWLDAHSAPLSAAHEQAVRQQSARLAELRDWRGFAAAPKRDELIAAIEALAAETTISDAKRHRRHQQLIRDWRQLGDAAATRELAQRFRAASDALHTQLADWEAELETRERDNLAARTALCEQLETLLSNPADDADPDGLRRIRDVIQEQWDRHWPVPKRQASPLGRRFARLRHRLQALIDDRAGDIAGAKRDLVAHAHEIAESEAPAHQRAEQAKALQQQWQQLGRAPKGVEQTLWRQFRSHCDTIFAAREALKDAQQSRQQARFDEMQALIDRLDAWQPSSANERDVLEAALSEAQQLAPLPRSRRSDGMEKRWQGIVHAREVTLERLALRDRARQWPRYRRWLEQVMAGGTLDDAPPAVMDAVGARRQPRGDDQTEEALKRCLVQLGLLAGEPIPAALEPLRLEVQVARLNDALGRPPTPPEELEQTLMRLLATAPADDEAWQRYAPNFDALMSRLGQENVRHGLDDV